MNGRVDVHHHLLPADYVRWLHEQGRVNETAAECVKDRPDRFGFFATLTLPDVDGALAAAEHAYDVLGADGIVLLANSRGGYLGSPGFDPLMAELDRRGAVVFVHPAELPAPAIPGIPPFAADFLLDTTRTAYNLVRGDVPRRYPGIRFDTALSASPVTLPSLLAFAAPGHVLYGSDWPYAPDFVVTHFNDGLDGYPGLTDAQRAGIGGDSAAQLFPRLF